MSRMYWVCDFLYMAAQIFVAIGLISAVSEPKRERNVEFIVNVLTIVLIAVLNTYNNSSNNGLFSNAMLLIIVAFISLSSWGLYRGRYWDVFFTYATFFAVVAIGDFFMLTCAYFILDYLNLPLDLFLRVNMYRGTYLLLYAVVVLCFGKLLKRGLTARKVSLCHFEFKSYVLVVLLWCCLIYFQRIYKLVVPEAFMRQWWLFLLTVVVMSLGFGGRMVKEKKDEQMQILNIKTQMWEERYQQLLQVQEERRVLQHDINHHLCMVKELLAAGQVSEAQEYVKKLTVDMSVHKKKYNTGHCFLDLVLNWKLEEAEEKQLKVEFTSDIMSDLQLNATDICALFCNLLDNAIEANERRKDGEERWLRLNCSKDGDMFVIILSNVFGGKIPKIEDGRLPKTTKEDKELHGYGMRSIWQVLDKYNGYMKITVEEDVFNVSIFMIGFHI